MSKRLFSPINAPSRTLSNKRVRASFHLFPSILNLFRRLWTAQKVGEVPDFKPPAAIIEAYASSGNYKRYPVAFPGQWASQPQWNCAPSPLAQSCSWPTVSDTRRWIHARYSHFFTTSPHSLILFAPLQPTDIDCLDVSKVSLKSVGECGESHLGRGAMFGFRLENWESGER